MIRDAGWWRAYRAAHRTAIQATVRARRATPDGRARHTTDEIARRARRRAEDLARTVPLDHPLLAEAALLVPSPQAGRDVRFRAEVMAEDARSEAVLAMVEGRDPSAAVRAYRAWEGAWGRRTAPLADWR